MPDDVPSELLGHAIFDAYEQVFGCMYSRPMVLQFNGMPQLLVKIVEIVEVGEYLGCMHLISPFLNGILLEHGQTLFQAIAKQPGNWGELAIRTRSAPIVKEAIIHLTGQWPQLPSSVRDNLPIRLRFVCETKVAELEQKKLETEVAMINYHPLHMERRTAVEGGNAKKTSRASYASEVTGWIILAVFRQYLGAQFTAGEGRLAADGGYALYKRLREGKDSYLNEEHLMQFHECFAMTSRGAKNLERAFEDFKEDISDVIAPLFANKSNVDRTKLTMNYLTCVEVNDSDISLIWINDNFENAAYGGVGTGALQRRDHLSAYNEANRSSRPGSSASLVQSRGGGLYFNPVHTSPSPNPIEPVENTFAPHSIGVQMPSHINSHSRNSSKASNSTGEFTFGQTRTSGPNRHMPFAQPPTPTPGLTQAATPGSAPLVTPAAQAQIPMQQAPRKDHGRREVSSAARGEFASSPARSAVRPGSRMSVTGAGYGLVPAKRGNRDENMSSSGNAGSLFGPNARIGHPSAKKMKSQRITVETDEDSEDDMPAVN
jgi:hypothetical protein